MLTAVQQLEQQIDKTVNWTQTALANQIASALCLGYAAAQNSGFSDYGWAVLYDTQTNLEHALNDGAPITLATLAKLPTPPQLKSAVNSAVNTALQKNLPALVKDIKSWSDQASEFAGNEWKAVQTAGQTIDAASQKYQDLMTKWAADQKRADDLLKLYNTYAPKGVMVPNSPAVQTLVAVLTAAVGQQIQSAADNLKAQITSQAKTAADSLATRLFDIINGVIDTAIHSTVAATIAKTGEELTNFCTAAAGPAADAYKLIWTLAVGLIETGTNITVRVQQISDLLDTLTQQLQQLQIPTGAPQDALNVVLGTRAALTRSLQQLTRVVLDLEKIRLQLPDPGSNLPDQIKAYCSTPTDVLGLLDQVGRCVDLRRRAAQAIADSLSQATAAISALKNLSNAAGSTPPPAAGQGQPPLSSPQDVNASLDKLVAMLVPFACDVTVAFSLIGDGKNDADKWAFVLTQIAKLNPTVANQLSSAAQDRINEVVKEFTEFKTAFVTKYPAFPTLPTGVIPLEPIAKILNLTTLSDRKLVGLLLQAAVPALAAPPAVTVWGNILSLFVDAAASVVNGVLLPINGTVQTAIQAILGVITPSDSGSTVFKLADILSQSTLGALQKAATQVTVDQQNLQKLAGDLSTLQGDLKNNPADPATLTQINTATDETKTLIDGWKRNTPGIIQTVQVVRTIIDAVTTGQLSSIFDITGFEKKVADALAALVPARIRLNYDFNTALSDFPSGDPIFAMDPGYGSSGPAGPDETIRNDLDLRTQVSINLITGQRDVSAIGFIRPFRLHLLGSALDLATIHFKGARFQASPGSNVQFTADIAGAEIGSLLSFLQVIEDYLSPTGGNGFYHTIDPSPLQIEVGYKFAKDVLVVGGLIFQNIAFGIGAVLPLDGRQAEFQFSLASRNQPFLISAPPPTPYGGGGFIALRATAQGVVAFEIQLEFGAIFGIQFGPLYATARITAGIYLLSEAGGYRVLQGFVQAVGEGNIACFSVAVLIQIKTSQQSDSSMQGSSTYQFAFKISSFFEIKYKITASYQTKGSGKAPSGNQNSKSHNEAADLVRPEALLFGAKPPALIRTAAAHVAAPKKPVVKKTSPKTRTIGPSMQNCWKSYRKYFEIHEDREQCPRT
jgi:hypothetical protein